VWIDFKNELSSHPQIPAKYLENIELCRRLHPDFEIKIWDGKMCLELLQKNYPWFVEKYTNFSKPIMRCDAIRVFILHSEGGVYSDIDIQFKKNIEPLLNNIDCLFRSSLAFSVGNDLMASKKGSEFMFHCCSNIKEYKFKTPLNYHILNTAGPAYISKQINGYKGIEKLQIDDRILPKDVFLRENASDGDFFAETSLEGLWQADWEKSFVKLIRKLLRLIYRIFRLLKGK
jgi:mannosyltransferase OCH1-like enzyme